MRLAASSAAQVGQIGVCRRPAIPEDLAELTGRVPADSAKAARNGEICDLHRCLAAAAETMLHLT